MARTDALILALLVATRLMFGAQAQSVGALGPLLVGPLVADFVALGSLVGAYLLPGTFIALPGAALSAWLGDRLALRLGLGLMALGGVLLALPPGPDWGLGWGMAARMLAGAGGVVTNLVVMKLVLDRFAGPRLPLALGFALTGWPAGLALSLLGLPPLAEALGWRLALAGVAGLLALFWLAVPLMGATGPAPRAANAGSARPPNWPALLAASLGWAGFNTSFIVILSFAPALLVAHGASLAEAGGLTSLTSWLSLPMLPLAGWLAGRSGRPVLLAALGLAGMAVLAPLLAWLPPGPAAAALLAALGVVGGLAGTPIFSLAPLVLPPGARALGMGAFYVVFYASMALAPPLAGWARDASGNPAAPIFVAAGCAALALLAVLAFPWLAARGRQGIENG